MHESEIIYAYKSEIIYYVHLQLYKAIFMLNEKSLIARETLTLSN